MRFVMVTAQSTGSFKPATEVEPFRESVLVT